MPTLIVSPLFSVVLCLIYIRLSFNVISIRRKIQVGVGDGENVELQRAIRVHGNFAEYSPFAVVLLLIAEFQQVHIWFLWGIAFFFIGSRLIHAYGVAQNHERLRYRVKGMKGTFYSYIMLMIANVGQLIWNLWSMS